MKDLELPSQVLKRGNQIPLFENFFPRYFQMRAFIDEKKPENGLRIIQQSEEKIKSTIEWLNKYEEPINQWLSTKVPAAAWEFCDYFWLSVTPFETIVDH